MLRTLALIAIGTTAFGADFGAGMKCYEAGDYPCAASEWQTLADGGIGQAQYNLGLLYARGRGVAKDPAQAAHYFEMAANLGIVQAQYNLGQAYLNGLGVAKDDNKAISWFQKAAELGDPNAANNLATVLEKQNDFPNALKWYQKAADEGLAMAQFNIGEMYDLGKLSPEPDYKQAYEWYEKAAAQGDSGALCNIAILYYNGEGVKVDREKAYQYLLLALKGGDPRASDLLKLTGEKIDKKQMARAGDNAREWETQHPFKPADAEVSAPERIVSADSKVAPSPKPAVLD